MDKFEIGEIAEAYNRFTHEWQDCEIIHLPGHSYRGFPNRDHVVLNFSCKSSPDICPNGYWWANNTHLRKKKPSKEETSWEELQEIMNWSPEGVTV